MTTIFHFHPDTGEYLGSGTARLDPRDKLPLIPAHATTDEPPAASEGEVAVYRDGAWTVAEDHRGKTVYEIATNEAVTVDWLGPMPEGYTEQPPPPTWEDIRAQRDAMLMRSDWTQLLDAPADKQAWATYRQALRDIPQTYDGAASVIWPEEPERP